MTDEFKRARDEERMKSLQDDIEWLKMQHAYAMDEADAWREQAEKLAETLDRLHELTLQGTNPVSIEASRIANEALRAYEAWKEGEE